LAVPAATARKPAFIAGLILYAAVSLWSLGWFPFVHSDEAWLASLTRAMIRERSLTATEDFFVLTPRYPHAIKSIYHLVQMPFVGFSFSAVAARLVSWATGVGSLALIWSTARRVSGTSMASITATVGLFAVDVQLLAAFHTARQEAVLILVLLLSLFLFFRRADSWRIRDTVILGCVLGGSIGIHPNSFIVAVPFVFLMFTTRPIGQTSGGSGRWGLSQAALLVATLAAFAILFVVLSLLMDRGFVAHYAAFGQAVGVGDSLLERWFRLQHFIGKLYHQTSGTYYLPPIRLQLLIAGGSVVAGAAVVLGSALLAGAPGIRRDSVRRISRLLICTAGVVIAIFAIGKFSPPSVAFILPPAYLLVGAVLAWVADRFVQRRGSRTLGRTVGIVAVWMVTAALIAGSVVPTVSELIAWRPVSYPAYRQSIRDHVEPDDIVLGNLNTAFALEYGRLRTWRDLDRLEEADLSFEEFVRREGVSIILYPDELDLIYRERPVWNDVYGNLYPYYEDLQAFLAEDCELVGSYPEPIYAMRLVSKMPDSGATLRIYRVVTDGR
jgi:dolichyl-phosphate-mannose-protein mannosyltransferase